MSYICTANDCNQHSRSPKTYITLFCWSNKQSIPQPHPRSEWLIGTSTWMCALRVNRLVELLSWTARDGMSPIYISRSEDLWDTSVIAEVCVIRGTLHSCYHPSGLDGSSTQRVTLVVQSSRLVQSTAEKNETVKNQRRATITQFWGQEGYLPIQRWQRNC